MTLLSFVHQNYSQTQVQFALAELIRTRSQVAITFPTYLTLLRRFDVAIEALSAQLDPTGMDFTLK